MITLHTEKVDAGSRQYFVDVNEDTRGNVYMSLNEKNLLKNTRSCVLIHKENIVAVIQAMMNCIPQMNN